MMVSSGCEKKASSPSNVWKCQPLLGLVSTLSHFQGQTQYVHAFRVNNSLVSLGVSGVSLLADQFAAEALLILVTYVA